MDIFSQNIKIYTSISHKAFKKNEGKYLGYSSSWQMLLWSLCYWLIHWFLVCVASKYVPVFGTISFLFRAVKPPYIATYHSHKSYVSWVSELKGSIKTLTDCCSFNYSLFEPQFVMSSKFAQWNVVWMNNIRVETCNLKHNSLLNFKFE